MKQISLIAAMTEDRVIGANNQLLWHLPNDFKHFKQITMGKPIIMGRKTFESIGRALPGRQNIVLTRQLDQQFPGCDVAHSVEEALTLAQGDEIMVIGGADIYASFMPLAQQLYITVVQASILGDAVFPAWDPQEWQECSREAHAADATHAYAYTFLCYKRLV